MFSKYMAQLGWWGFWLLVVLDWFGNFGGFNKVAVILWFMVSIAWLVSGVVHLFGEKRELKSVNNAPGTRFWGWVGLWVVGLLIILGPISVKHHFSIDSAQEIGCGIAQWQSLGQAWYGVCFLDYPARQYILPSLITMIWGRSVAGLNLGQAVYLLAGWSMFLAGVKKWGNLKQGIVVVIGLGLVLANQQHLFFLWPAYEQALYPLSFSLYIAGIWLFYRQADWHKWIGWLGILGLWLIHSYTVNLALVMLLALLLGDEGMRSRISSLRKGVAGIFVGWGSSFVVSILYRGDLRLGLGELSFMESLQNTVNGLLLLLWPMGESVMITPLIGLGLLAALLWLLKSKTGAGIAESIEKKKRMGLAVWLVAAVFAAMMMEGFANYSAEFKLHRLLMLTPMMVLVWMQMWRSGIIKWWAIGIIYLCLSIGGLWVFADYRADAFEANDARLHYFLQKRMGLENLSHPVVFVVDPSLQGQLATWLVTRDYLYPQGELVFSPNGCDFKGEEIGKIIIMPSGSECIGEISEFEYLGELELHYQKQIDIWVSK